MNLRRQLFHIAIVLFLGGFPWSLLAEDDESVDVEALLADDALLDDLLFGEATLPSKSEEPATALWDIEHQLLLGGGYKTNVLFSAFSEEDSAFALTEWETTVLRLGRPNDWKFLGYVVVENRHYADVDGLNNEWLGVALAQVDKPLGRWSLGLAGQYMYLQQAFSLEFEELDLGAAEITLHQFMVTPKVELSLTEDLTLGLRAPVAFNRFRDSQQNYDELALITELQMDVFEQGKLSLSYGYEHRDYAERTERESDGDALPGTSLSWDEHQLNLSLGLYLDEAKRWKSKTLLRHRRVEDSGSGFQDFVQNRISQTLTFQHEPWTVALNGSYAHYDYPVQTKAEGDGNLRHRSRLALGMEAKRAFGESWEGFARYAFESYLSNVPEDQYDVHVFTLGIHRTF